MGLRTLFFSHSFLFFLTHFLLGIFYSNLAYNLTVKCGNDNQSLLNECMVTDYGPTLFLCFINYFIIFLLLFPVVLYAFAESIILFVLKSELLKCLIKYYLT